VRRHCAPSDRDAGVGEVLGEWAPERSPSVGTRGHPRSWSDNKRGEFTADRRMPMPAAARVERHPANTRTDSGLATTPVRITRLPARGWVSSIAGRRARGVADTEFCD
jgi:hypothetical protein